MEILKYIQVSSQSATNICYLFNFKHAILKIAGKRFSNQLNRLLIYSYYQEYC